MSSKLILVRHSSDIRQVGEQEVVAALTVDDQRLDRDHVHVDTSRYEDAINQGDWTGQDSYLSAKVVEALSKADAAESPVLHYFGLAEIPHVIALGAYFGDERMVHLHEHNRATGDWRWPDEAKTLDVEPSGLPDPKPVLARGSVVLRVPISVPIADSDVLAAVGDEHLADVTVGLANGAVPTYGDVRSLADLEAVRVEFRKALAAVRRARPNIEIIHLFVGAGSSVCFAIGQELKLRNSPPVQTYRYRVNAGEPSYKPALLLGRESAAVRAPLTVEQVTYAADIRANAFSRALNEVVTYSANKKDDFGTDGLTEAESAFCPSRRGADSNVNLSLVNVDDLLVPTARHHTPP